MSSGNQSVMVKLRDTNGVTSWAPLNALSNLLKEAETTYPEEVPQEFVQIRQKPNPFSLWPWFAVSLYAAMISFFFSCESILVLGILPSTAGMVAFWSGVVAAITCFVWLFALWLNMDNDLGR